MILSKLFFELFQMSLRNGIDSSEDVPVDKCGTRRRSYWTFVGPSVVEVNHIHKGSIVKHINLIFVRLSIRIRIPL